MIQNRCYRQCAYMKFGCRFEYYPVTRLVRRTQVELHPSLIRGDIRELVEKPSGDWNNADWQEENDDNTVSGNDGGVSLTYTAGSFTIPPSDHQEQRVPLSTNQTRHSLLGRKYSNTTTSEIVRPQTPMVSCNILSPC